jgi:hypothetical protein
MLQPLLPEPMKIERYICMPGRFLTLCFLLISFSAFSQKYILSPKDIDDPGFEHVKVIGQDDNGFYLLQSNLSLNSERDRIGFRNRKYKIGYYDFNLNEKWSKKLEDETENHGIDVVTMFNGHPFILRSQWLKNENTLSFSVEMLDDKGNSFNKKQPGKIVYTKDSDLEKPHVIFQRIILLHALLWKSSEIKTRFCIPLLLIREVKQFIIKVL